VILEETKVQAALTCRGVVADAPGQPIRLTLYSEPGAVASVEPDPIRSILLASKLIEAAGSRLSR
jgi:hypothetical protein